MQKFPIYGNSPEQGLPGHPVLVPNHRFQAAEQAQEQHQCAQYRTKAKTFTSGTATLARVLQKEQHRPPLAH